MTEAGFFRNGISCGVCRFFFEKFLKNVSETDTKTSRFCAKDAGLLMRIFINRLHFHTIRHFDAGIKRKMQVLIQNSMSVSDMFL